MLYIISNMLNELLLSLHSCFEETMRASVVLLFAFLALTFVAAYAAVEVSDNIKDGRLISQSPPQRGSIGYWWVVIWSLLRFEGQTNFFIGNMRVILCPTQRIEGVGGGMNLY